jgi:hypothetical protein
MLLWYIFYKLRLHADGLICLLSFMHKGPKTATRGGVNGSLKFLSKLSTTVPKSTPKGTQTKATKTRATKSQETLEKFLRSLETQRKRRNSNRRSNGRKTNKTTQNIELWTVCYSILDSPLFKNQKLNFMKIVLFSVWMPLLQYLEHKYGHRATKEAQKKSWLLDCLLQYSRHSANCESARIESSKNRLLTSIFWFAAKPSPTATKLGEHDHKAVRELPLRGHRPIWSQSMENQRETKNTGSWYLDKKIIWSASSWGIGWFSSVERLNSRHSSKQWKRTDQNSLETMNQLKNEREKEKNTKNTSWTQRVTLPPNHGGHKEDSGPPFPLEILVLTQITRINGPLSHKQLGGNPNKEKCKWRRWGRWGLSHPI